MNLIHFKWTTIRRIKDQTNVSDFEIYMLLIYENCIVAFCAINTRKIANFENALKWKYQRQINSDNVVCLNSKDLSEHTHCTCGIAKHSVNRKESLKIEGSACSWVKVTCVKQTKWKFDFYFQFSSLSWKLHVWKSPERRENTKQVLIMRMNLISHF